MIIGSVLQSISVRVLWLSGTRHWVSCKPIRNDIRFKLLRTFKRYETSSGCWETIQICPGEWMGMESLRNGELLKKDTTIRTHLEFFGYCWLLVVACNSFYRSTVTPIQMGCDSDWFDISQKRAEETLFIWFIRKRIRKRKTSHIFARNLNICLISI